MSCIKRNKNAHKIYAIIHLITMHVGIA